MCFDFCVVSVVIYCYTIYVEQYKIILKRVNFWSLLNNLMKRHPSLHSWTSIFQHTLEIAVANLDRIIKNIAVMETWDMRHVDMSISDIEYRLLTNNKDNAFLSIFEVISKY